MKIDKEVYRYINFELQHFEENKKKLENLRAEILDTSPTVDGQPRRKHNKQSNRAKSNETSIKYCNN